VVVEAVTAALAYLLEIIYIQVQVQVVPVPGVILVMVATGQALILQVVMETVAGAEEAILAAAVAVAQES
jgi:hypothetical protein